MTLATPTVEQAGGFLDALREQVASHALLGRDDDALRDLLVTPLSRYGDPVWILPEEWLPAGLLQALNVRTIAFRNLLPEGTDEAGSAPLLSALRRAVVCFLLFPHATESGIRQSKPSTVLSYAKIIIQVGRKAIGRYPAPDGTTIFAHLSTEQIADIINGDEMARRVLAHLHHYRDRGLIADAPSAGIDAKPEPGAATTETIEKSRRGAAKKAMEEKDEESYQPYPDDFVSELGWRCLWLMETLGPTLLDFWEKHGRRTDGRAAKDPRVIEERRAAIEAHPWRAPDGTPIERLPFKAALKDGSRTVVMEAWPPKNFRAVAQMVGWVQMAHYTLVSLATGARWSEHSGATVGSVEELDDGGGRWHSRTWKLEENHAGVHREWPLPPEAVNAIRQQERLARFMHPDPADTHLWVTMRASTTRATPDTPAAQRPAGSPLLRLNETYEDFILGLGLDGMLKGIRPHAHRWRKTLARLAAMALVGAPKILMDLFGHNQIEMTLRYILSNPDVVAEIEDAARAYLHAMGEEILAEEESEELTGEGTGRVEALLEFFRARHAEGAFGTKSMEEVIEILIFNGKSFTIVRPGIVCLKSAGETGACTRTCAIDPAQCGSDCSFHVGTHKAETDADATIRSLIAKLMNPDIAESEMVAEAYRGQIVAHLNNWEDLRTRWLKDEFVVSIWSEAA